MDKQEEVKEFVARLSAELHQLDLPQSQQQELASRIADVQEQLENGTDKHGVVSEALEAMQRMLEASATQRAAELLAEAGRFLTGVG